MEVLARVWLDGTSVLPPRVRESLAGQPRVLWGLTSITFPPLLTKGTWPFISVAWFMGGGEDRCYETEEVTPFLCLSQW